MDRVNKKSPIINGMNKPVFTIQVIRYYCTNCGEEKEEVKLCPTCKSSMRVVEVVEKYGEEAKEYLQDILGKRDVKLEGIHESAVEEHQDDPSIDKELDITETEADSFYGTTIFPDDDGSGDIKIKRSDGSLDQMLTNILDEDEEDDDEFSDLIVDGDPDSPIPVL